MTSAAVTHFSGDPFHLFFWLRMYEKYWRGEVDHLYIHLNINNEIVPAELNNLQREKLSSYPEIVWQESNSSLVPEVSNPQLIRQINDDSVFLIESDSFLFRKGYLSSFVIGPLERGFDLVGSRYVLLPPDCTPRLGEQGLMRNFLGIKRSILEQTDIDFMPRRLLAGQRTGTFSVPRPIDVDCFGWMSLQLLSLTNQISYLPNPNLINSRHEMLHCCDFRTCPYLHIRQFNSSILGMGQPIWKRIKDGDQVIQNELYQVTRGPNCPPMWYYKKAIAFRLLFIDFIDDPVFALFRDFYLGVLDTIIQMIQIDRGEILSLKEDFKTLLRP